MLNHLYGVLGFWGFGVLDRRVFSLFSSFLALDTLKEDEKTRSRRMMLGLKSDIMPCLLCACVWAQTRARPRDVYADEHRIGKTRSISLVYILQVGGPIHGWMITRDRAISLMSASSFLYIFFSSWPLIFDMWVSHWRLDLNSAEKPSMNKCTWHSCLLSSLSCGGGGGGGVRERERKGRRWRKCESNETD